ncbi:MAG TPA: ammonium transporter, partial [Kiloniellaceae bacterium]|nr:ammonium transporter [Kiloniellaceae bacterium]
MGNNLDAITTVFTEFYYWLTVALMFLIHVGFCMYEVGASRAKNKMHTLMKNSMIIPLVTVTWFFFGWWIYWAVPAGPGITGGLDPDGFAAGYTPWSDLMGTNLSDRISGVFWAAFLLFSWTAASIVSGAVIERIRSGAFWIFAVLVGSVTWVIDAAWGWHYGGWMVQVLGYHDAYASGVIHAIAGGAALGVLVHLGPRFGKFDAQGNPREILPHNPWLVCIGLFLIYTGFWGFYVACNVPIISPETIGGQISGETWTATTIYLTPTTLSAITFNFLMSLA